MNHLSMCYGMLYSRQEHVVHIACCTYGMLHIWHVVHMACGTYGMLCIWHVVHMACCTYGMVYTWHVVHMACCTYGILHIWHFEHTACCTYGMLYSIHQGAPSNALASSQGQSLKDKKCSMQANAYTSKPRSLS